MKAGIVTRCYENINYGGNLQAYALCRVLERFGVKAEQIQVRMETIWLDGPQEKESVWQKRFRMVKRISGFLPRRVKRKHYDKKYHIQEKTEIRREAFMYFNQKVIPHGENVYNRTTIRNCLGDYDMFVTGSDQVWNMEWYLPAFFLEFVPDNMPKFSYAASLGRDTLTEKQRNIFKKNLSGFIGVSVREEPSVELLKAVSPVDVTWVLDPTLLLEKEEWNTLATGRVIKEKYIFCYFLGNSFLSRELAAGFSEKKQLKIVTIPFLQGAYRKCDIGFGDIRRSDISPEMFLALIRDAEYIFTDSFHALVFSHIFEKQYFLFKRGEGDTMSSRIYSLCRLLGTEERFCDEEEKCRPEYLDKLPEISYLQDREKLENMKKISFTYLKNCLKKAEDMIQ